MGSTSLSVMQLARCAKPAASSAWSQSRRPPQQSRVGVARALIGVGSQFRSCATQLSLHDTRLLAPKPWGVSATSADWYHCRLDPHLSRRRRPWRSDARASASSRGESSEEGEEEGPPPQEAVLKAISEVSKVDGRFAKTTNLVIGGTESPYGEDWLSLDKKVNRYPSLRGFTAIGTGGDDFVHSMVVAVESVLLTSIPEGRVRQRESAQGRYISVKIGPLRVESSIQVREIYQAMKRDVRMKYFL